jgi:peptide deformylase
MIVVPVDGKIKLYGPAMVNIVSEPVLNGDYKILPALREYMVSILQRGRGDGLAAPQVGVHKQFVIFRRANGQLIDMVNPEITQMYGRETTAFEFCVSLPPNGNGCMVPRMENVGIEYESSTLPGFTQEVILTGPDAIVAQHQIDLLTGTFYIERASGAAKRKVLEEYAKWKLERTNHVAKGNTRPLPAYRM